MKAPTSANKDLHYQQVQNELVVLVETARGVAVRRVNALMSATYWEIGRKIVEIEQDGAQRADYGEALIDRLAKDMTSRLGRGFSGTNLKQMRSFYLVRPLEQIRQTLSDELPSTASEPVARLAALSQAFPLPWSAYVALLSVKNETARQFYEIEALRGGWNVRQIKRQINSQFYERTALSKDKAGMLKKGQQPVVDNRLDPEEMIKDPFLLEFLDLKDEYSESELEAALIERLTDFLLELGDDFAFVGRQRRLRLDDTWFRVDLIFFHRQLKCLVIIDLKVGRFSHADAGQMHMYLNYAKKHWMKPGENPPVGVILAASKGAAEAHYSLEGLTNKVLAAEYKTVLPDESLLADELTRVRQDIEQNISETGRVKSDGDTKQ